MQVPGRSGPEAARRELGGTGARRAPRAMAGGAGGCKTGDAGAPHQSEPTPLGGGRRQRDPHAPDAGSLGQRGWHVSAELREGVGTLADSASGSLGFTKSAELSAAPPADASHTDGPSRGSHPHPLSRPHQATPPCTCLSESAARVHPRPWGCPPRGGPESPAQRAGTCPTLTG